MFHNIKKHFEKPSAMALAVAELEQAKRELLAQQSAAEYHKKLAEYCQNKIVRLSGYIGAESSGKDHG
jgi:hypothetical protein